MVQTPRAVGHTRNSWQWTTNSGCETELLYCVDDAAAGIVDYGVNHDHYGGCGSKSRIRSMSYFEGHTTAKKSHVQTGSIEWQQLRKQRRRPPRFNGLSFRIAAKILLESERLNCFVLAFFESPEHCILAQRHLESR